MPGVANVLGTLLAFFGVAYIIPVLTSFISGDGKAPLFLIAAAISSGTGFLVRLATRKHSRELKPRDGFLLATLSWVLMSLSASLPLLLAIPGLSFTDAYFEAMSGLTTTGSTILTGLDNLPHSINIWRHTLHWLGGHGYFLLAVAILPLGGVGGCNI
jgi:trk system potassium uptake protein TrkH